MFEYQQNSRFEDFDTSEDVETLSLNLDMPTSQAFHFLQEMASYMKINLPFLM